MADRPVPQAGGDYGRLMEPRPVTEDDLAFWTRRNGVATKIEMKGEHIGARNIEVVRSEVPGWGLTWNVPYVDPESDGSTYWFSMFCDAFPPVSAVVQAGNNDGAHSGHALGAVRLTAGVVERWNGAGWESLTGPQPRFRQPPKVKNNDGDRDD